jgi:VWFA-related protein
LADRLLKFPPVTRRAAAFLICGLQSVTAQNTGSAPAFRAETRIVQVPVSVTDMKGRSVEGLEARDFLVLSDGIRQEVTLDRFDTGVAKISLAIAVQTSGISTPALTKIHRIGGMIQPLVIGSGGEAAVLSFDDGVTWLQDFTPDSAAIQRAVKNLKPGAYMEARMFDAIAEVSDRMKQRSGRKVLLLISESRDRGSKTNFAQAMEAVGSQGIEVFGAHYSAYATTWIAKPEDLPDSPGENLPAIFTELGRLGKVNAIEALTQGTGGSDYPFLKERGVENAIEKLGVEVHSQYILSFSPRGESKGMHRIDVSVTGRGDLRVHSRRAWWPDPAS